MLPCRDLWAQSSTAQRSCQWVKRGRFGLYRSYDIQSSKIDFFWFFRAADRALQGKDLERELADAQSLSEQYLACLQRDNNPGGYARQVDPT